MHVAAGSNGRRRFIGAGQALALDPGADLVGAPQYRPTLLRERLGKVGVGLELFAPGEEELLRDPELAGDQGGCPEQLTAHRAAPPTVR